MVSCICGSKKKETEKSHYEGFRGPIPSDGAGDDRTQATKSLPKVFVSRLIDPEAIRQLKLSFEVDIWDSEDVIPRQRLIHDVEGAAVIFSTLSDIIDMEVLDAAGPQLKLVCNMAADFSNVDVPACERRSIKVHCTGEACTDANAELTCALLLMISRKLLEGHEAVLNENWDTPPLATGLANGVLGFLGFGRVGWAVASRLQFFGLSRIIYYDQDIHPRAEEVNAEKVDIEDVFSLSDFIVVTMALNASTRGIVDAEKLGKCKPECIFINTSRGALVNHDDLAAALENKQLAAVGLDVTEPEPLPADHPLMRHPNCIITPHIGTATSQTRLKMAMSMVNVAVNLRT